MYDKELVLDLLSNMLDAVDRVINRTSHIKCVDDFLKDDNSLILLDSICMQLIAIGEAVKKIDKITDKRLLSQYPKIQWREIAGMRDVLSHHYFDLNADIIFDVIDGHIEELKYVLIDIKQSI